MENLEDLTLKILADVGSVATKIRASLYQLEQAKDKLRLIYTEQTVPDGCKRSELKMEYNGSHSECGYADSHMIVAVPIQAHKDEFLGSYIREIHPEEFLPEGSYIFDNYSFEWEAVKAPTN